MRLTLTLPLALTLAPALVRIRRGNWGWSVGRHRISCGCEGNASDGRRVVLLRCMKPTSCAVRRGDTRKVTLYARISGYSSMGSANRYVLAAFLGMPEPGEKQRLCGQGATVRKM